MAELIFATGVGIWIIVLTYYCIKMFRTIYFNTEHQIAMNRAFNERLKQLEDKEK